MKQNYAWKLSITGGVLICLRSTTS